MIRILFLAAQAVSILVIVACATESTSIPTISPTRPLGLVPTSGVTPAATMTSVANGTMILSTPTIQSHTSDVDISFGRRTPFVPLYNPTLLSAGDADYLQDDDLVLGLEWDNTTHAYPVRMLRFHHIVNDTIAGRQFLITY